MFSGYRVQVRGLLLTLVAGGLTVTPIFAQPPRTPMPTEIAGEWDLQNFEEDTLGQPSLGDYTGIPFNAAGRLRSDTTPESIWGTPEYLCRPHSAPHQWRGLGGARVLKEQDPLTRDIRTFHVQFMRSLDRPIFMDDRPHPPAWAPHSWTGFSTGEWIGNTLKVTTTHLKDGYLRRGGPQTSDMYAMTEYLTRHGDILSIVTVIDDPIYLDEPLVHSTTYVVRTDSTAATETCSGSAFVENGGTDRHWVPHFLPGENTVWQEWLADDDWIPEAAVRGGIETRYPEYRSVLDGSAEVAALRVPGSTSTFAPDARVADQSPRDGQVHVMPVQGNVYMLVADGNNITASVGEDGILLVNSGSAEMSDSVLDALNQLAIAVATAPGANNCFGTSCPGTWGWSSPYFNTFVSSTIPPRPVRYIINTSGAADNIGGNLLMANAGFRPAGVEGGTAERTERSSAIVTHENVLFRLSAEDNPPPRDAWPTETYFDEFHKLPSYFNGEGVMVYHAPEANTDGDSIVLFRHSEVISAGDIYSTVSYPVIDVDAGGSVQGVIDGLNHILDLSFAEYRSQGGTWIIPGRGRLSDTADVASYRNMVTIIRDRVQDMIDRGLTLDQIQNARPTLDFDGRYGTADPEWTPEMFIEAVYLSLAGNG
jgi:glyoxylase-like metal-dependent hydrolase (beta-lactamase superfamily II)